MNMVCGSLVSSGRIFKRPHRSTFAGLSVAVALAIFGGAGFAEASPQSQREVVPAATPNQDPDRRWGEGDQDYARRLFDQGLIVSLESVIEQAKKLRPGDLLEAELESKRGRHVYEVEILDPEGHTWELKFDARDGRLLKEEQEDH